MGFYRPSGKNRTCSPESLDRGIPGPHAGSIPARGSIVAFFTNAPGLGVINV